MDILPVLTGCVDIICDWWLPTHNKISSACRICSIFLSLWYRLVNSVPTHKNIRNNNDFDLNTQKSNIPFISLHNILDSGCKGIMISSEFTHAMGMKMFELERPIGLQLACMGSKSTVSNGTKASITFGTHTTNEYFDIALWCHIRHTILKTTWRPTRL